jgi:hypothetical protein
MGWNRNIEGANTNLSRFLVDELDRIDKHSVIFGLCAADRETQKIHQAELRRVIREEEIKWMRREKIILS